MTEHQRRVDRTQAAIVRAWNRAGRPYEWEWFPAWHLRHGGRAPGEREHAMLRVSCDTCALSPCRGCECEPYCFRRYDLHDAWRPKKGGAR